MLKSIYSYPNQKNTSRACSLPPDTCSVSDMVKVNLFTKLDDCKVNKSKLIYDKCGKDLKCKIDDKTKNELKDKVKKGIMDEVDWCRMMDLCDSDKSIGSGLITEKNIQIACPDYAERYKANKDINKPGWSTGDLLGKLFPDLMSNKKITSHFYTKDIKQYHAGNFKITFKCEEDSKCGSNIQWTWSSPTNMWCNTNPEDQGESICYPAASPYSKYEYSKNFFLNNKCPNLILNLTKEELAECAGKTIVAKLESPLIIADYNYNIIDKDGNNTGINYYILKAFLNSDGATMKNCDGNEMCQKYAKILDKILWTSDKEIKLTIPGAGTGNQEKDNQEASNTYFSESESMDLLYYNYGNDLI